MVLSSRYGPAWALHSGGSSLRASALQSLLQGCLVVSTHLLSLRPNGTTSWKPSPDQINSSNHLLSALLTCMYNVILMDTQVLRARTSLCHSPAVCPWVSHFPSLCLIFLICKTGMIITPSSENCWEDSVSYSGQTGNY